jgi:pimeloyl-ACP methyl ester carboxylesterase
MPSATQHEIRLCSAAASPGRASAAAAVAQVGELDDAPRARPREPALAHWFDAFAGAGRRFVTYDGRGYGLSDGRPPGLSFEAMVHDLEAVADAARLERFPIIGFCHGGPIAMAYAARHPGRVSRLVLCDSYAHGGGLRDDSLLERAERESGE